MKLTDTLRLIPLLLVPAMAAVPAAAVTPRTDNLGLSGPTLTALGGPGPTFIKRNSNPEAGSAVRAGLMPPVRPLFDAQIRDTQITRGHDGRYYLTGSSGDDIWRMNDGVELWVSDDLTDWDYLGLVWSFEKDATWQRAWRDHNGPVRALWAPEIHYVKGNYAGDYYKTPSIPAAPAEVSDVEMQRDADGIYRIYVPEYRNIASGAATRPLDSRARLAVTFETESVVRYVDFKYYDTPPSWAGAERGDHFDILRNNIYDYTLTHIDGTSTLKVEVDVIPYTEIKLKPEFGLERDNETGWIIIKKYDPAVYYYDDRAGQYYDGDKHAMPMRVSALPDDGQRPPAVQCNQPPHRPYSSMSTTTTRAATTSTPSAHGSSHAPTSARGWPRQSLMDKENIVVLITDEYGKAIFMYDPVQNTYFNEIWSPLATPPNFGYQHWTHPRTGAEYMVIKVDYKENPVFFYDPATDRYYENDTKEEGFDLTEVQAFPPKE